MKKSLFYLAVLDFFHTFAAVKEKNQIVTNKIL
jgi:hypothetical protein